MNPQNDLQKVAQTYESLLKFASLIPKPAWKKYELAVSKAYLLCATQKKTTSAKKETLLFEAILKAEQAVMQTARKKRDQLNELLKLLGGNSTTTVEDDIITDEGYDEYGNYIGDQEEDENEVEEEPTPAQNWTPPKLTDALRAKFKAMSSNEVE